jgi:hypothetical protein
VRKSENDIERGEKIPRGGKIHEILMRVSENQCSPVLRGGSGGGG